MDLLRLATVGSVDDGKSTLIGRLLYDAKQIFADQLEAIERASVERGADWIDLSLLTDGLRSEREQGITIDVAYRYFATPKRSFVMADTPGHIQYTRNMVTGASTADVALILIDARGGVLEQTRRHAFLTSLMRVPHLIVCVNKMDLVEWSEERFEEIVAEFGDFAAKLEIGDIRFLPVSALKGDNVVERSANMDWYAGEPLLTLLEHLHVAADRNLIDVRFPVQYVIRPHREGWEDYRGYAGQVASGALAVGDEVIVLPSGLTSTITHIDGPDGPLENAYPPLSVTLRLADDIDVGRGDMICRPSNHAAMGQDLEAMVCWLSEESALGPGRTYTIRHTTNQARVKIRDLRYRLDINTLSRDQHADQLALNEIGRIAMRVTQPLLYDPYRSNRAIGSFVLVDETTFATVAGGMLIGATG